MNKLSIIILSLPTIFFLIMLVGLVGDGIIEVLVAIGGVILILFTVVAIILFLMKDEPKYALLCFIISFIEVVIFFILTNPWWQPIVMGFYLNPVFFESVFLSIVVSCVIVLILKKKEVIDKAGGIVALFFLFLFFLLIFSAVFALFTSNYYACRLSRELDIEYITQLPEMDENFVRVTPMKVGDRWASDACQYPRHTPAFPSDISMLDGKPHWNYLLVPDGAVNVYNIKPVGAIFIDMTTIDKNTRIVERELEIAPQLELKDGLRWRIFRDEKYFITCERVLVFVHNDTVYQTVPYIEYDFHFEFPVFYTVPKWGGVFLIDEDGNIDDLSPQQARESPILEGQKLFPEQLVLTYINSERFWKAKQGSFMDAIYNVWFDHVDELEITDVSGQGNQQPFLMNTENGLKWIVSVEPFGVAHGIYRIYLLDARTGLIERMNFSSDEIGPVRACNYVRQAHPDADWDLFQVIEPIPVTPNGKLFWETRVVPREGSGIAYVAFVDPITGRVVECETDEEISTFLSGVYVEDKEQNETMITGIVFDIDTYTQFGNSRWLININGTEVLAKTETLEFEVIKKITDLEVGNLITVFLSKYSEVEDIVVLEVKT